MNIKVTIGKESERKVREKMNIKVTIGKESERKVREKSEVMKQAEN